MRPLFVGILLLAAAVSLAADAPAEFKYASLKGATNEQIARFMSPDGDEPVRQAAEEAADPLRDFWKLTPPQAALALADALRTEQHRKDFRLKLDIQNAPQPPAACSILFADFGDSSYTEVDRYFHLRIDPKGSSLSFAGTVSQGIVFRNFTKPQTRYTFGILPVKYEDALHIFRTLWWLREVGAVPLAKPSPDTLVPTIGSSDGPPTSTADGNGSLMLVQEDGSVPWAVQGRLRYTFRGVVWRDGFDQPEAMLHAANQLIGLQLLDRIGGKAVAEARDATERTIMDLLDRFSLDQKRVSYLIVRQAVRAAGAMGLWRATPKVETILSQLPPPAQDVLTADELQEQGDQIRLRRSRLFAEGRQEEARALHQEEQRLYSRLRNAEHGIDLPAARKELRGEIGLARERLQVADRPDELLARITLAKPDRLWALNRLREINTPAYAEALTWLVGNLNGSAKLTAFEALADVDPALARQVAAAHPADAVTGFSVAAFRVLAEAKDIPQQEQRVNALVAIVSDPVSDLHDLFRAVRCLVPEASPLRFPSPKIDEALRELLTNENAEDHDWRVGAASRALALRGRLRQPDVVLVRRVQPFYRGGAADMLWTLTIQAHRGDDKDRATVVELLRGNLRATSMLPEDIVRCAWALDVRELAADLRRIATADPAEAQGADAHGGFGSEPHPLMGRYHAARQVLALWEEPDARTRAKLLVAFGVEHVDSCAEPRRFQFQKQLTAVAAQVPKESLAAVRDFLEWYEKRTYDSAEAWRHAAEPASFGNLVRGAFSLPP